MNIDRLSEERVGELFQNCWDELIENYIKYRVYGFISSEKDLQFVLAHNLMNEMRKDDGYSVHIEFPIPFNVEKYKAYMLLFGKIKRKKKEHFIPDIVVIHYANLKYPIIIAEIKYVPEQINPLTEFGARLEDRTMLKEYDEAIRSRQERYRIDVPYVDSYVLRNIDRLISVLNKFKEKEMKVQGYLCIVDEFCPNIAEQTKKKMQKFNPPPNLKILATFFNLRDILTEALGNNRSLPAV